jgi:hypothetical protein
VADVGEEKSLVDGDVGGILVVGGVGGAFIGVPFPTHVGIAALLLVVLLLFLLLPSLVSMGRKMLTPCVWNDVLWCWGAVGYDEKFCWDG